MFNLCFFFFLKSPFLSIDQLPFGFGFLHIRRFSVAQTPTCCRVAARVPKCLQDVDDGSSSDEDDDIDPHKDLAYDDMILLVAWPIADGWVKVDLQHL